MKTKEELNALKEEVKTVGEKLAELSRFFDKDRTERGTAFLYRILELLRETQNDPAQKMPLARLAYMLSRLEAPRSSDSYRHYKEFSGKMGEWALNGKDRASLITAILIHVYQNRGEDR